MAIANTNLVVVATLMIIMVMKTQFAFAQLTHPSYSSSPPFKQRCGDMFNFIKTCAIYMHKFSPWFHKPNDRCCENARKVNISMFCKIFIVREVERVFNPRKVAVVARHCNNPLPLFSKCGSYFVKRFELTTQNNISVSFGATNMMTSLEVDDDNNNFCP